LQIHRSLLGNLMCIVNLKDYQFGIAFDISTLSEMSLQKAEKERRGDFN